MTDPRDGAFPGLAKKWADALARSEPDFDEAGSHVQWLAALQAAAPRTARRRVAPGWSRWMAAAAVVLLGLGAVVAVASRAGWRGGSSPSAGLDGAASRSQPLVFGDGSRVEVEVGSQVRVASADPQGARIVVERGTVHAEIIHRADTRWAFESGPFVVRVTGTQLSVHWDPTTQDFSVQVRSGSVWVTGPMLEGGRSVTSGHGCRVNLAEARLAVEPLARDSAPGEAPSVAIAELPLESGAAPSSSASPVAADATTLPGANAARTLPRFVELERAGRFADALAAAERAGIAGILAGGSTIELMSLERAARFGGRPDLARRVLTTCRSRFPGSADAATAAYLLGRSAPPLEAARWFESYLAEHPGGALAREAAGRVVESYHHAGNAAAARTTAQRYLARYPDGPHAAFARQVLGVHVSP